MQNETIGQIITLNDFVNIRNNLGKIVCASGGFDPVHPGHTHYIMDSKKFGDTLVVIVNGDNFLIQKKGYAFMDLMTRCLVVASIKHVDYVIPYNIANDNTVIKALQVIKPNTFTKGGDRINKHTIPEWDICKKLNIEIKLNVGLDQIWSSSSFVKDIINNIKA
jgi:D-beta-D-heptose 7-phosphate kinase/D-beta-D-heptose 1-phosphate adenosyltransferase